MIITVHPLNYQYLLFYNNHAQSTPIFNLTISADVPSFNQIGMQIQLRAFKHTEWKKLQKTIN